MSAKPETPIFKPDANATPVSKIHPPPPDLRRERVHRVHGEIAKAVKDANSGNRGARKSR